MQSFFSKLMPFIFLGIIIVLFLAGLILLSYLLIYGAILGLILFGVAWIRDVLFKKNTAQKLSKKTKPGRTIDHDGDSSRGS